jgi:hypothetical protein
VLLVLLLVYLVGYVVVGLFGLLCCYWFWSVMYSLFGLSGLVHPKLVPASWDVPLLLNFCWLVEHIFLSLPNGCVFDKCGKWAELDVAKLMEDNGPWAIKDLEIQILR